MGVPLSLDTKAGTEARTTFSLAGPSVSELVAASQRAAE